MNQKLKNEIRNGRETLQIQNSKDITITRTMTPNIGDYYTYFYSPFVLKRQWSWITIIILSLSLNPYLPKFEHKEVFSKNCDFCPKES